MHRKVCAAAIQFNVSLGDVEANLHKALEGLARARARDARLAVLPEMWSTGYDYKRLPVLAEETPRILERLCLFTAENRMVVVGSLPTRVDGKLFNTLYVVDNGAVKGSYSKIHLFSTMGEDRFLTAGDSLLVLDTSVGRLGTAICYDVRFPEMFRKMALDGAEIICLPAEWPKPRQEHWRTLIRARAIENQLFLVAANCCGIQGQLDFFGMSMLVSARGEVLAEAGEMDTEPVGIFDFEEMEAYRAQIRCYHDRRPEIYGQLP